MLFCPTWFAGMDIIIDVISFIVLFGISGLILSYYKINNRKKHLLLATGFFLLGLSFVIKIITSVLIHMNAVESMNVVYISSLFGFRFIHLIGLLLLILVYKKSIESIDIILITTSFLMLTYFSYNSFFYSHVMATIMYVYLSYIFINLVKKNQTLQTKLLATSFVILAISQAFFILAANPFYFVISETIQLIGYIFFFATYILVIKNGKKKR